MLKIARSFAQLIFSELMNVYVEGNILNGREFFPKESAQQQLCNAEQDFYHYLKSVFFRQSDSWYAIWEAQGRYVSALRLEPYSDGYLLCALETAPDVRQRGYAKTLICAVQSYLAEQGSGVLYSHVSKRNAASLAVHKKCGFQIVMDHAVYSDGSVHQNSYTLAYPYKKSET